MREKGIYGEESFCAVGGRYAVSDGSESLNLETRYKSLEEWNYLFEVSLAMMLEEEYQVEVTPEDFDCTRTLGELFHRVCEPSLADKN